MQIEQTHTQDCLGLLNVFSQNFKFIIVNLKRKRVSMSEASHLSKFKMVWIWSARQFKQNGPLKKKSLMGVKKNS